MVPAQICPETARASKQALAAASAPRARPQDSLGESEPDSAVVEGVQGLVRGAEPNGGSAGRTVSFGLLEVAEDLGLESLR